MVAPLPPPPRPLLLLLLLPHRYRQRKKLLLRRPRPPPALPRTKKIPTSALLRSFANSPASTMWTLQKSTAPAPEAASLSRTYSISSSTVRLLQLLPPHPVRPQLL